MKPELQTEFKQLIQIALVEFRKALDANNLELAQYFSNEAEELLSHYEDQIETAEWITLQ